MAPWPVHQAKSRFAEVMARAEREGPQVILRHGIQRAVLLSIEDYRKLTAARPDLRDWLLGGPKVEDFEAGRPRDLGRAAPL